MAHREDELLQAAADFGAAISPACAGELVRLVDLVLLANARVRLTAITAWRDILAKHLLDSLAPLALGLMPRPVERAADLGSGGGFPGLVLAAAAPGTAFVLIEATQKKAEFLAGTAATLGLTRVEVWAERAEEAGKAKGREAFTLVTARAVADLRVLVELALPLLKMEGMLMAWKGPEAAGEVEAAANSLARLGGEVKGIAPYELPYGLGSRNLVTIRKVTATPPEFPRRPGMAEKKPL